MLFQSINEELKKSGQRLTPARKQIIQIFCNSAHPITAQEIIQKMQVNKTTVYRELQFLLNQNIITSLSLTPSVVSYELLHRRHHHHITCTNCGKIEDVILNSEKFLDDVKNQTQFFVKSHSLEFYGQCAHCK